MSQLIKYEAARKALAEARSIDEVKPIRNKMIALAAYAKQAKDLTLIAHAQEIKLRAERRMGELLRVMPKAKGGTPYKSTGSTARPVETTLKELEITKTESSRWQKIADLNQEEFDARTKKLVKQAVAAVEMTPAEKTEAKRLRREEREAALGRLQHAMPEKEYGIIYADPPWRFEPWSRETGMDRAADNHYPTMLTEDIKRLQVPAANDCVLFLWATVPMLPEALEVMTAWGFTYKSQIIWVKNKPSHGYWFKAMHEILLVGTKGNVPAPAPGSQPPSVIEAPIGKHSEKPEWFRTFIANMFPSLPRIELFARSQSPSWDSWGNEI
jgi:N6-adenosine-specific RNA methylase IME4